MNALRVLPQTSLPLDPGLQSEPLIRWLVQQGLEGADQETVLAGYCDRLVEMGVPLLRLHVAQSAFHPRYGGVGFDWMRGTGVTNELYEKTETPSEKWRQSPMYYLLEQELEELRVPLHAGMESRFPLLDDLREMGATEYFATGMLLCPNSGPDQPWTEAREGVMLSWTTNAPNGFSEHHLTLIREVLPHLGLALKSAANRKVAEELLGVYLGRDAGGRVLSGEIQRGSLRQINAVICSFDLTDFTSLSERTAPDQVIAMLNDYFALAVGLVESHGGHVLKFMGDGMLAMFDDDEDDMARCAASALEMAATLPGAMAAKNAERAASGLPVAEGTLALHAGELLYGNIGAEDRLDFTVIGSAVNLTARLSGMHRTLGRDILVSEHVLRHAPEPAQELVSLGRYMLRGVSEPQELFTIHRG